MFIETEQTPNPATLKFLPGQTVLADGAADFRDAAACAHAPLAKLLFAVDGVKGVFLARDFITVTKSEDKDWRSLKPHVLAAIMDHFVSGLPAMEAAGASTAPTTENGLEGEIIKQIRELIEQRVRPAVAQDGGDITFNRFEDGVVYLNLKGSCAGCPSSTATLKSGIENMLKHYIPEVQEVRQVL